MDKHIKQTEAVQRQSAHFMKICWERTPGTVPNLLRIRLAILQDWRKIAHLTLFHKAVHGESALEFPIKLHQKAQSPTTIVSQWQIHWIDTKNWHLQKFFLLQDNKGMEFIA